MALSITEDIRTVSELKRKTRELLAQVKATRRPLVVTVKGRAEAVVVDAESFERLQKAANLAAMLSRAEADVRAGRLVDAEEFFDELVDE